MRVLQLVFVAVGFVILFIAGIVGENPLLFSGIQDVKILWVVYACYGAALLCFAAACIINKIWDSKF